MPTISSKLSHKEHEAIVEYANQCGETVSNLIRKTMITQSTMLDCVRAEEHPEYQHSWIVPNGIAGNEEDKMIEGYVNRIRRILGWKELHLS